jgi:hypothetical protein
MLQSISWSNYLAGAALIMAVYYAWFFATYYRDELNAFIKSKRQKSNDDNSASDLPEETEAFPKLENIVHEINGILDMAGQQANKDQLLSELKLKLANYDGLRLPAYRVAVFNHIIKHAEETCGVRISADELEGGN